MMTGKDRRAKPRIPAEQTVQLTILGTSDLSMIGRVIEISGSGMRLLVDCPVESGAPIHVVLGDSSFVGNVRYCRTEGGGFVIGLHLDEPALKASDIMRTLR